MARYCIPFVNLTPNDVNLGGGKATSLAHMLRQGIPVPPGFVITTDAFTDFESQPLSDEFKQELTDQFNKLGSQYVAVRSSAIAEDSSEASWAGQLESYLNVSQDNLIESVQKCWTSIKSSRAQVYAKDRNISDDAMKVAVVVQAMVNSEVSGVMFTAHPITGDTNHMVIESAYGLGEMVVGGMVTPDSFELSKQPFEIVSRNIQTKAQQMVLSEGKNVIIEVPETKANAATLQDSQVQELAHIGLKIEKLCGKPQDIEWAFAGGEFYVVQARPITTL